MMTRPGLQERIEQKFFVAPSQMGLALALLRRTCRRHEEFPEEQINSLYFDTPDLDQHERSMGGEFVKDKIRVRWYGQECDPHFANGNGSVGEEGRPVATWLELKSRRGFASTKQRRMLETPADALAPGKLCHGIIPAVDLMQTMADFGFLSGKPLRPVIVISYWRRRFVEPCTGAGVALDSHIRSSAVMPGLGCGERGLELPGAIIEVKGRSLDLPYCIRQVAEFGSSWTRYSKYSSSIEAHGEVRGSVSRLWPSGTVHAVTCTAIAKPK